MNTNSLQNEQCVPDQSTRFKAGASGNPRGRPCGSKNTKTIVQKVAHEQQLVREDGKETRMSVVEMLLNVLSRKALEGNLPAKKLLDELRETYSPSEANGQGCLLVVPEPFDIENGPLEVIDINVEARRADVIPENAFVLG